MNTTTATAPATATIWDTSRDKYGRTVYTARRDGRTLGVVVRLPKTWTATHPTKFLSNDWAVRGEAAAAYHMTKAAAMARIEAL